MSRSVADRFWRKVDRNGPMPERCPELGPCWIWLACTDQHGYGAIKRGPPGGSRLAHVVGWELARGAVPDGLELDHLCRNPACVNPDHLEAVTHRQNMERGSHATKTHCIRGHPFDPENTIARRDGSRACRSCKRDRKRADYRRRVLQEAFPGLPGLPGASKPRTRQRSSQEEP